jgi:hypothetical protein
MKPRVIWPTWQRPVPTSLQLRWTRSQGSRHEFHKKQGKLKIHDVTAKSSGPPPHHFLSSPVPIETPRDPADADEPPRRCPPCRTSTVWPPSRTPRRRASSATSARSALPPPPPLPSPPARIAPGYIPPLVRRDLCCSLAVRHSGWVPPLGSNRIAARFAWVARSRVGFVWCWRLLLWISSAWLAIWRWCLDLARIARDLTLV